MKLFRSAAVALQPADATTFVGPARTRRLASGEGIMPVTVYHVEFGPAARTNWHLHTGPQWLLIVDGRVRIQKWGEPPLEAEAGDAVLVAPGEKHWHGAAPGARGTHLAINVDATTEWLEQVSDVDYNAKGAE
jgi:quercetin dioxygenase-like cupin family protein